MSAADSSADDSGYEALIAVLSGRPVVANSGDAEAPPLDAKRLATLRALCALRGVSMTVLKDNAEAPEIVLGKWGMQSRTMRSLEEVDAWLRRLTGE